MNVNSSLAGPDAQRGFHPEARYEFKIHTDGAAAEDRTYRVTFDRPDGAGEQAFALHVLTGSDARDDPAIGGEGRPMVWPVFRPDDSEYAGTAHACPRALLDRMPVEEGPHLDLLIRVAGAHQIAGVCDIGGGVTGDTPVKVTEKAHEGLFLCQVPHGDLIKIHAHEPVEQDHRIGCP